MHPLVHRSRHRSTPASSLFCPLLHIVPLWRNAAGLARMPQHIYIRLRIAPSRPLVPVLARDRIPARSPRPARTRSRRYTSSQPYPHPVIGGPSTVRAGRVGSSLSARYMRRSRSFVSTSARAPLAHAPTGKEKQNLYHSSSLSDAQPEEPKSRKKADADAYNVSSARASRSHRHDVRIPAVASFYRDSLPSLPLPLAPTPPYHHGHFFLPHLGSRARGWRGRLFTATRSHPSTASKEWLRPPSARCTHSTHPRACPPPSAQGLLSFESPQTHGALPPIHLADVNVDAPETNRKGGKEAGGGHTHRVRHQ
ncbi:hypothetical protein K438DRAFT_1978335 [Mycena galopus ATCC 62051]|nr:hypothetical protein K438DRAFT_1978335 [Mycena galopus ATCC 62051]